MNMARRPIGIEAAPTRAALESLAIQLHHFLPPDTLNEILLLSVETALREFENPEDVAKATGKEYAAPADAYKVKLLFRRVVEKLVATQDFPPSAALCEKIELLVSEVDRLQSIAQAAKAAEVAAAAPVPVPVPAKEPQIEDTVGEDISLDDDDPFAGYQEKREFTYEDLRGVFAFQNGSKNHFGAVRMDLDGYGPCLVLGYVFTKDMVIRRTLSVTILTPAGKLLYNDTMFNYVDSLFKTIRHEANDRVYLIKAIPYFPGSKGRCWLNKKGNRDDKASKVYFILGEKGIEWVSSDTYYALDLKETSTAAE